MHVPSPGGKVRRLFVADVGVLWPSLIDLHVRETFCNRRSRVRASRWGRDHHRHP